MASSYTSLLRLTKPATGDLSGLWGDTINNEITSLLDQAVAGRSAVAMTDANYTLTALNGTTDEARSPVLRITGTLTAARNVICPTATKLYIVENATTGGYAITLKTSAGTGISVANGQSMFLRCDGTNVVNAFSSFAGSSGSTTSATTATNLAGGANGSVPYQTASGATSLLAAGTAGQLLQTNGAGAPSWVTALASGTTATTQTAGDNSTKVATTAYVDRQGTTTQAGVLELATTAEVQAGTDTARAVTPAGLQAGKLVSMGQVSASSSVVQFTLIPSWVRRITIQVDNVSPSTTARIYVQLGDAGGLESSGYASTTFGGFTGSAVSAESNTTGFFLNITGADAATNGYGGTMVLTLMDAASFKWICNGSFQTGAGTASGYTVTGYKSLTATLDRVALVTSAGTFDAGSVNVLYE